MADLIGRLLFRAVDHFRVRYWNPTRDWPASSISQLSYDMRERGSCGVAVDARLEALKSFGAADWFSRYGEGLDLYYYRLGLVVGLWRDHITSFEVILDPQLCPDYAWHAFAPGRLKICTLENVRRDLTRTTGEGEVLTLLGVPSETGPVLNQRVHTFITAENFIHTYHHPDTGRLVRIELSEARRESAPAAA
jgi:hypothetical protein